MQQQFHDFSELDELTEENLDFSALSDGLGFHKDSKKRTDTAATQLGTGATLAGPIRVSPAITAPVKKVVTATPSAQARPEKAPWLRPAANPALRSAAFITDLFFVTTPMAIACRYLFTKQEFISLIHTDRKSFVSLYLAILAVYFLLSESFGGQSLGKILWNLQIVEDDKYEKPIGFTVALVRLLALTLGALPIGLGLFTSFQDSKLRAWHDKVTRSIVRSKSG